MRLVVIDTEGNERALQTPGNRVSIGREQDNDLRLSDASVSSQHCRIVAQGGRHIIVDLNSTNGTFVNGRRLERPHIVSPADAIRVGPYVLRIENG